MSYFSSYIFPSPTFTPYMHLLCERVTKNEKRDTMKNSWEILSLYYQLKRKYRFNDLGMC